MKSEQSENEEMSDANITEPVCGKTSIICVNQWSLKTNTVDYFDQDIQTLLKEISRKIDVPIEILRLT